MKQLHKPGVRPLWLGAIAAWVFILAIAVVVTGCKMDDKETRAKIKKQNAEFVWEVKPEWEEAIKPKK